MVDRASFTYTNHRGETSVRTVFVSSCRVWFGASPWHPEPQWLMDAEDADSPGTVRTFALKNVNEWHEHWSM